MCTEQGTDNPKESSSLIWASNFSLEFTDTYEILDTDLLVSCCLSLEGLCWSNGVGTVINMHVKGEADGLLCFVFHLGDAGVVALC